MFDSRIQKMAEVLIRYSTATKPGDLVLIRGLSPHAEPLMQALYQEALRVGAHAFPYMHISQEDALAIDATGDLKLLAEPNPMLIQMYEKANVVIRIESTENDRALSSYPSDRQDARGQARYAPIKIQMEREANKTMRRCTTLFPTHAYAQTAGMSLMQYSDFVFKACKVHLDDPVAAWLELRDQQQRYIDFLSGKKKLEIHGENIDMIMSIEGRTFLNASGEANFPDGEIFTGPVEDSVNGWVRFTYPAYMGGNEVQGIELKFENGKVTDAKASRNEVFLKRMLDTDANSRTLGEFAIGTNTDIQQFTGSILFDEKIGGTVHMAIGQGYPETGSTNRSNIHWDMICDMRGGSQIAADGEVFYENGKFII